MLIFNAYENTLNYEMNRTLEYWLDLSTLEEEFQDQQLQVKILFNLRRPYTFKKNPPTPLLQTKTLEFQLNSLHTLLTQIYYQFQDVCAHGLIQIQQIDVWITHLKHLNGSEIA